MSVALPLDPAPSGGVHPSRPGRRRSAVAFEGQRAKRRAEAERQRAALAERTPQHVQNCVHNGGRSWWIYTWRKVSPDAVLRVPYQCNSWRCTTCRKHESHVQFARIKEASADLDPRGWVFLTTTLRRGHVKTWRQVDDAYRGLRAMGEQFLKRFRRWSIKQGWYDEVDYQTKKGVWKTKKRDRIRNRWVAVVEAHRSGFPHMHWMLYAPELAQQLRDSPEPGDFMPPELRSHAAEVGWGPECRMQPSKNTEALAGYMVKLAGEQDALTGELAKMTQLPTMAPIRFRRLRSGKGFLPPRRKNPDYTGTLVRRQCGEWGLVEVNPVHKVADNPTVQQCCAWEEHEAARVANTRSDDRFRVSMVFGPNRTIEVDFGDGMAPDAFGTDLERGARVADGRSRDNPRSPALCQKLTSREQLAPSRSVEPPQSVSPERFRQPATIVRPSPPRRPPQSLSGSAPSYKSLSAAPASKPSTQCEPDSAKRQQPPAPTPTPARSECAGEIGSAAVLGGPFRPRPPIAVKASPRWTRPHKPKREPDS